MKPLKILWCCSMIALFIAGRITGKREFFLMLFIMGFVLLYALVLNLWTIFTFCYVQEIDRKVTVKGAGVTLRLSIHNDKPFIFPLIRLMITPVVRSQQRILSFSLLPHSNVSYEIPLSCPYKGIFNVGMSTLEVIDCFGLLNTTFKMNTLPYYRAIELKIYPKLIILPMLPAKQREASLQGFGKLYAESGGEFASLRAYRAGDPLKRVHRVASAKYRELYVKTYDVPLEASVLIVLDTIIPNSCSVTQKSSLSGVSADTSNEDILYLGDLACECAAAIAHYSMRMGNRVIYSDSNQPDNVLICESLKDFQILIERLTAIQFDQKSDFSKTLMNTTKRFPEFHTIYVLSAGDESQLPVLPTASGYNVKLIRLIHDTLSTNTLHAETLQAGVQYMRVAVGDDIAAILSEVSL